MKLTTFIIAITLLQVSASTKAQINLDKRNATLKEVLKSISQQTGYDFLFNDATLKDARRITIQVNNQPLETVLKACFENQPLSYAIEDKTVVIKEKTPSFLDRVVSAFINIDVRGRVVDSETGAALAAATVKVKGTSKQTSTNGNGEFYLADVEENAVLEISFIGYKGMEVKANKNLGEIKLLMASSALEEVTINKGYYTTTRLLNTGNVSKVTATDIERQPVSDPMLALQGRVPGLFIQQQNGNTGRSVIITLRGKNSIANGNNPLFIVDGIQFNSSSFSTGGVNGLSSGVQGGAASPFELLNPSDIESVEVLKDADATAIYGSRGANGVILITTKRAKSGKTKLDLNVYTGASKAPQRVEYFNTQEYLAMRRQAFTNDNVSPQSWDYDVNGTWGEDDYTNWQDLFIGGTEKMTEASASISGGSQSTSFRIGGTYRKQGTVYFGDFLYNKAAVQFNVKHMSLDEKFSIQLTGNYSNSKNKLPTNLFSPTEYYTLAPNFPYPFEADGTLNWDPNTNMENPMSYFLQRATENSNNLLSGIGLEYKISRNLVISSNLSYHTTSFNQTNIRPFSSVNPTYLPASTERKHEFAINKLTGWMVEPKIAYQNEILKGKLNVVVGTTIRMTNQNYIGMSATNFSSDALLDNFAAGTNVSTLGRTNTDYKYHSIFARVGYSYQDTYVMNLTANRDGSSRFGLDNKFGNFGAIGAAWIFSKESFVKKTLQALSFGKLRFSYGTAGNDQIGDYNYLDTYQVPTGTNIFYQGVSSLQPTQLTNPYYGWERVNKFEVALELGLFENRVMLNTAFFRNRTKNQLVRYGLPTVAGFNFVVANLPAILQNGGVEIDVTTKNIEQEKFSWTTNANITFPNSKLVSYPKIAASSYATRYAVGEPLFLFYGYHYTGVDASTGKFTFQDFNGDNAISTTFDKKFVFVGQKFYGGIQNNFRYQNFELDFLIQFTKQNGPGYLVNGVPSGFFNVGNGNQFQSQQIQQKTSQSDFSIFTAQGNFMASDGAIMDASYLRLKNISLSWRFPFSFNSNSAVKNVTVYVQGQNLLTLTDYQGFDPESPSGAPILPPLRTITAGLRLSL